VANGAPERGADLTPRVRESTPERTSAEGYAETLAAIDNDAEALDELARISAIVAEQAWARARRLRTIVRPEIERGYAAAEAVVDLEIARRRRSAGRRLIAARVTRVVIAGRIAA